MGHWQFYVRDSRIMALRVSLATVFLLVAHALGANAQHLGSLQYSGSPSTFWNGGLAQTSLSAAQDTSGEYLPPDRFKDTSDWSTKSGNVAVSILEYNANGFPSNNTNLQAVSGWRTQFGIPSQANRSGNYISEWSGANSTTVVMSLQTGVSITGAGCSITGNQGSGAACKMTWTPTSTQVELDVTAVGAGGPDYIKVYHVNDAALVAAGSACAGTAWASVMGQYFGIIRDLNRSDANFSNVAVWADRTPTTWFSYGANNYFPSARVTPSNLVNTSGAQYTLAFGGFSLTDKVHAIFLPGATITPPSYTAAQTITNGFTLQLNSTTGIVAGMHAGDANSQNAIQFTAIVASVNSGTNTVTFTCNYGIGPTNCANGIIISGHQITAGDTIVFSPMFCVNGTTCTPVLTQSGVALGTQNFPSQIYNHWSTLTYDLGLNAFLLANNQNSNSGLQGGYPTEWFVRCANDIGAYPWLVQPPYSMDPPTDYAVQQSSYTVTNLKPGIVAVFEPTNELWNYGFFNTQYADNKEFLRTGNNFDHDNWYGRVVSQMGQTISSTYGANRNLYKVEACMPPNEGIPTKGGGGADNRVASPEYVAAGGSAAYNWITDICINGYYQSSYAGTVTEVGLAYWWANGGTQSSLVGSYLAGTMTTSFPLNLYWYINTTFPGWATYITSYAGTATMVYSMYEGGYASNAGCGYSYVCAPIQPQAVTSVTLGNPTILNMGANAWNYICNTASKCTGGQPTTLLAFGGGCGLNGLDPAVTAATSSQITVAVNSTGFTGCTTGTATYDGAAGSGGYVTGFELAVKQDTTSTNLQTYELNWLQSFYTNGGRRPAEYDSCDQTDWGKCNPDVYATGTPVISAIKAFQLAPWLLWRDIDPASNDNTPAFMDKAA